MDRLEAEWDNLRAALTWSRQTPGGATLGLALMGASWWFWELRGRRREARVWLVALLEDPTNAAPTPERARALFGAAYMADNEGDQAYSDKVLEDLEQVGQQLGDPRIEALVCCERGSITREATEPHVQIALLKRSLTIFQQIGDQLGMAWALWDLGVISGSDDSDAYFQDALALARTIGDTNVITMSLDQLAHNAMRQGELTRAEALLEEAVAAGRAGGDLRTAAHSTASLGTLALACGDLTRAEAYFSMVLEPSRKLGEIIGIDMALTGLALVAYWRGDSLAGEEFVAEALANSLIKDRSRHEAWLIRLRGALAEQRGDLGATGALLEDSLARYRALDDSGGIALALASIGHLRQRGGDLAGAEAAFREGIARYHNLGYFGVATCLIGFAALAEAQGDAGRAARLWGAAEGMRAGSRPDWSDCRPDDAPRVAAACARLHTPALAAAWAAGAGLTTAEAVAEALGEEARDRVDSA
jgi:tetratricopeptide (TPR) repeat protein